jgi:hypothetical protein
MDKYAAITNSFRKCARHRFIAIDIRFVYLIQQAYRSTTVKLTTFIGVKRSITSFRIFRLCLYVRNGARRTQTETISYTNSGP